MEKQKILIFIDWYFPAYKAGGPIQSIKNFVENFHEIFDIYIFTSNGDFDNKGDLEIVNNSWIKGYCTEKVFYCSALNYSKKLVTEIIKFVNPSSIYINSMFSLKYALIPLWSLNFTEYNGKIVLAPRGMLQDGAMKFKYLKKKTLLTLLNIIGIEKKIDFQATDHQEEIDIKKYFKKFNSIIKIGNLTAINLPAAKQIEKKPNELKIIFLSRIVEKKNLLYLLNNIPQNGKSKISINIYGDIGDVHYFSKCEKQIQKLNDNGIVTKYGGVIENRFVFEKMQEHHLYILPTFGENFGHSIFEAFSASRPVIISNQTPWQNLKNKKAGFNLPLENSEEFKDAILYFANMNQDEFNFWVVGAKSVANNYIMENDLRSDYIKLFS